MLLIIILLLLSKIVIICSCYNFISKIQQKIIKFLSKAFERSVYWNEYKTKCDNKNTTNEFRYFLESYFVAVNRLLVLVYSSQDADSKRFKAKRYYLPKGIIKNYKSSLMEKMFMTSPLILIQNGMKKLENWQQGKVKITRLDAY